jgi:hypothetical protein
MHIVLTVVYLNLYDHVEDEPEEGANEEGMENGEGTGNHASYAKISCLFALHPSLLV